MKILVKRIYRGTTYTIGQVYIDGKYFCDSLEDTCRITNGDCSQKIYAKTAIPEDTYDVEVLWWDKHNNYYPHIINVPCFKGIMIHGGLDEDDTEGCILLGENKEKGHLQNCGVYVRKITELIKNNKTTIEII